MSNLSQELFQAFEMRIETIMATRAYGNKVSNYIVNKNVIRISMVTVEAGTQIIKRLYCTQKSLNKLLLSTTAAKAWSL